MKRLAVLALASVFVVLSGVGATAQQPAPGAVVEVTVKVRPLAPNVVLPQRRVLIAHEHWHPHPPQPIPRPRPIPTPQPPVQTHAVEITGVKAHVRIERQVATTTLDISLRNPTRQRLEAEVVLPVPETAAIRAFDFQGAGKEPSAQLLRHEEARRLYDSIVAQTRDPALLEFIGYNLIRSSVFPVEPGGTQKVRVVYEHVCPADGQRVDYVLPRTEAVDYRVPWDVSMEIVSPDKIATVYSPSHEVEQKLRGDGKYAWLKVKNESRTNPGAFRVSYLRKDADVTASLLAYPDPKIGGGYFMLLGGLPADLAKDRPAIKREVTLVIDRSGSMNGEKLEQVREAAKQIIAGLNDGERFNLIVYNEAVDAFSPQPVEKNDANVARARSFIDSMTARGGTNIHDALLEALRQKPTPGSLPLVLFLTDGRPTIGQTAEKAIRELATKFNPHERRVFTFGVGVDVNSPLLENIAYESRAVATYVLPTEDVEVKVAGMFRRLSGPVLAEPTIKVIGPDGKPALGRVADLMPVRLPDLFDGDQLVLLGRYVGEDKMRFNLAGNLLGDVRAFDFDFDPSVATTRHAFVARLWANRKIGVLIDAIRSAGADPQAAANDPKFKELVDEIVAISTEFGILTEYTAFFVREGTDLGAAPEVAAATGRFLREQAQQQRGGLPGVAQDNNSINRKSATKLNYRNGYWGAEMKQTESTKVQQVADCTLWKRGDRWIDAKLAQRGSVDNLKADQTIEFGTNEYFELAHRLAKERRNGLFCFDGDALVEVDGKAVLVKAPTHPETPNK